MRFDAVRRMSSFGRLSNGKKPFRLVGVFVKNPALRKHMALGNRCLP